MKNNSSSDLINTYFSHLRGLLSLLRGLSSPLRAGLPALRPLVAASGLLLATALSSSAQTQFMGWLGTFQNYKINKTVGIYFDGQLRTTDQLQQVQSVLIRPGVNFYLSPRITATAGYAYIPHRKTVGHHTAHLPEHRTWQQLTYTHPVRLSHHGRASSLQHRLRLEQRYLPKPMVKDGQLDHDGFTYAGRLRYFFRGIIPLSGQGASFDEGLFTSIQNEIFANIGDNSPVNGKFFDQNRAYFSVGYRFSKQFDLETGYINQYISGTGNNSTNNHIVQVATYLRL